MSTENPSEQLNQSQAKPNGPGALLRKARLEKGLSPEQVAEAIHLSLRQVEAIENDDYSDVTAIAYAKGHLGLYAKLTGLSVNEILKAFDNLKLKEPTPPPAPSALKKKSNIMIVGDEKDVPITPLLITGVAVVILLMSIIGLWRWHAYKQEMLETAVAAKSAPPAKSVSPAPAENTAGSAANPVIQNSNAGTGPVLLPIPPASNSDNQERAQPPAPTSTSPEDRMPQGPDNSIE
jgi:cytoskeleton protein RodZ